MANFTDKLALLITANSTQAVGELRKTGAAAETSLGKAESASSSFTKSLVGVGAGGLAAVGGVSAVAAGLVAVVGAGREAAQASRITDAVLKSTGSSAHVTAGNVTELARSISRKTGIDDTAVRSSENLLLTFTNVRNEAGKGSDIFNRATKDIQDMSVAIGQDARSSTIQLGKALQDPILGLTSLRRVGVAFTDQQKEQIKVLVKSGDVLGAQKIILSELEKEFGGAAAAAADPISKLSASFKQLEETIGQQSLPTVNVFTGTLQSVADVSDKAAGSTGNLGGAMGHLADGVLRATPAIGFLVQLHDNLDASNGKASKSTDAVAEATKAVADATKRYAADIASGSASSKQLAADAAAVAAAQERAARIQQRLTGALEQGTARAGDAKTAAQKLSDAQKQLNADLSSGNTAALGADRTRLKQATFDAAAVEYQYAAATRSAQLASDLATGSVISLADAYQILGSTSAQAATQSVGNLSQAAFSQFDATQNVAGAMDAYNTSLDNLTTKSGGGGAGGAAKNLTAEFYNQQQKIQAVRDALQAVADDQVALTRAQRDEASATKDAADALVNYRDTLKGVNGSSPKAKSAKTDVAVAKEGRTTAVLDLNDAERQLDADRRKFGSHSEQVQRDEIRLQDAHRTLEQKTIDLNLAQQNLNGTLHGFAQGSPQMIAASDGLQAAQDKLHDSVVSVREATDSAHDAQVGFRRSLDDLQGKLNSISTGGASKQVDNFKGKLDAVKTAAKNLALDVAANVTASGGTIGQALIAEIGTLKSIVDSQPALKGAFDSVLAGLNTELQRFLTAQSGRKVSVGNNAGAFADGGWVPGPAGAPMNATVHGGEFVLSRKMIAQGIGGGGGVTVQATVVVSNRDDGRQIVDKIIGALNNGHGRQELRRLVA